MKIRNLAIFLLFTFFAAVDLAAQNPYNQIYELEEAIKLASEKDKKVLIDIYAEWCPYCGSMHSDTYTDERVKSAIDEHFLLVTVNIESSNKLKFNGQEFTEREFSSYLSSGSVPTTFFLDSDGEILGMQPGLIPADVFSQLLNFVGSDAFLVQSFDEYRRSNQ